MCNYIRTRFPCGTTVHKRIEWQNCEVFLAEPYYGPCKPPQPSHTTTFIPATASDSSYKPTSDSDSDAPIPIRCHLVLCRKCNTDITSYRRALSARIRQNKYGPDEMADWYGYGDPDVDPNFPQYQEWLKKQKRIALLEKYDEAADADGSGFWILNPSETWRGGECGWKTKNGEPIEKVDRGFQWAAKSRLREKAWAKRLEEREEALRVHLAAKEKKRVEEETKGNCMCLDGAQDQETGGQNGEREDDKWEKTMAMSIDSLASLSL